VRHDIESIVKHFCISGRLTDVHFLPTGHINDTYVLTAGNNGHTLRYLLQRINHTVFNDPCSLMRNVLRVTEHIRVRVREIDPERASRQLTVVPTAAGEGVHRDRNGNFWRIYNFIEGAVTYDKAESVERTFEAARMFGSFQRMLIDLPPPSLNETICDFHNTPKRLETFRHVCEKDPRSRAGNAKAEIDFAFDNAPVCDVLVNLADQGEFPVRVTHNDAKINNVMLDENTDKGVCVIDLDTVMPGLSVYDFGDMVRTAATSADEDERDLSKVSLDMSMFEAIVRGFADQGRYFLTPAEKEHLVLASKLITFEQFIRFLSDYLAGDVYYRIHRRNHNLDRSRTQMKLVRSIIEHQEAMNQIVEEVFRKAD
jgi:Ser/Thr protein kinase RdoA (MazF antagonist)